MIQKLSEILSYALQQINDEIMVEILNHKTKDWIEKTPLHWYASQLLTFAVQHHSYHDFITQLALEIMTHENLIQQRVADQSYALMPRFIDDRIAHKIMLDIVDFFGDIASNQQHIVRTKLSMEIEKFALRLQNDMNLQSKVHEQIMKWMNEDKLKPSLATV